MDKQYTIIVKGTRVPVSEEIYRAYYRCYERERYLRRCALEREVSREKCEALGIQVDSHLAAPPDDVIAARSRRRALYAALAELAPQMQEALWQLVLGETTERALAAAWGVSKTTVHKRKTAALAQLRRRLQQAGTGGGEPVNELQKSDKSQHPANNR